MNRRSLLLGVGALIAAPSIVRVSALMPVSARAIPMTASELLRLREAWERRAYLVANPPLVGSYPVLLSALRSAWAAEWDRNAAEVWSSDPA